jgi:hypothetical protein
VEWVVLKPYCMLFISRHCVVRILSTDTMAADHKTFSMNGLLKYFSALQGNENTCSFPYTFYVPSYHATQSTAERQHSSALQLKDF